MIKTIIRSAIRSSLIQRGPQTCSDLVRALGLAPREHKGTIHAMMLELEREGVLGATRSENGKRDLWFTFSDKIRRRDRLTGALFF